MRKRRSINNFSHKCALEGCNKKVGYHKTYPKLDGTTGVKWKTFCEYHRRHPMGRKERENFLKSKGGCANRIGILGHICQDPDTPSLTIDHWDGNRHNNNPDNLVVLCANCHNVKTKLFKDHLKKSTLEVQLVGELFEIGE